MPQPNSEIANNDDRRSSNSEVRNSSNKRLNPSERASLLEAHNIVKDPNEEPEPVFTGKKFFGIQMKPGASFWNLMSVFFLQFFVMVVADDYIALEQPLLMNKNYYNKTSKEATKIQMYEGVISGFPSLIFMFITGYVYDIVGVRWTLGIATFFSGASLMLYPLGAPHLWLLYTGGCLFGIGLDLIGGSTLIMDFVEVKDRGKAVTFGMMGVCAGVILSNQVLVHLTFDLDPILSWGIMSGTMVLFSISMLMTLDEPKDRTTEEYDGKTIPQKVWHLTKTMVLAMKKRPNLLIGWIMNVLVQGPIMIFELYFFSWLQAWCPDDGTGPFPDQDTMMNYYELQSTLGSICAFFVLYVVGTFVDKIHFRVMLPITLIMRACVYYLVFTIKDPVQQSTLFWIACPMMHVCFYISAAAMQGYLLKIYPKEIRGMCVMTSGITGYVFGAWYPFMIQWFYEIGPRYVFLGVSCIDCGTIVLCFLFYLVGFGKENTFGGEVTDAPAQVDNQENQDQATPIEHQRSQMI